VWVYDDTGSGAFTNGSAWRPVVPPGYVAIGDVAVASHDRPGYLKCWSLVTGTYADADRPASTSLAA
jgi:hypothetical protein